MKAFKVVIMRLFKKIIETCCELSARVGMAAVFILLALTVCDVAGRYIFNSPIPGTFELTKILFALSVFFSFAISQFRGENLGITLLYNKFPTRVQGILDLFSSLLSISMFVIALYQIFRYAERMRIANTTTSVLRWPIYPWIYLASVGMLVLVIALVWDLGVSVKELKGEKNDES